MNKNTHKRLIIAFLIGFLCSRVAVAGITHPVAIDRRIKTLVYSPNEIIDIVFPYAKFSMMFLEPDEDLIFAGFADPGPWTFKAFDKTLLIKAIEPGVRTNMIIKTTRREYLLDVSSTEDVDDTQDDQAAYVVRFFYPETDVDAPRKYSVKAPNLNMSLPPSGEGVDDDLSYGAINYRFTFAGTGIAILPEQVFDVGGRTYFRFPNSNELVPVISEVDIDGRERRLRVSTEDSYIVVNKTAYQFTLRLDDQLICIFNETLLRSLGDELVYEKSSAGA